MLTFLRKVTFMISQEALAILFTEARTHSHWLDKPVTEDLLKQVFDLAKMGPTSANCSPMRIVFIKSPTAKEKLKSCLDPLNIEKTMTAPVTAIIGMDYEFYEHLPKLFPHADARSWFAGNQPAIDTTTFRNASLQGGYFILAARALGLDCGPMSGFNNQMVDELFFSGTQIKSNFLCNLGYGDTSKLFPRSPRFTFEEACRVE
jgi:3-hydroxypropanoate dehydrogenase